MSDAFDPTTMAIGAGTDAFKALTGLGFGIYDRIAQANATKYQVAQDIRNFNYQTKLNEQAQANYEKNFAFQEAQANQQQENFNKVFEANRIGNLMKEYKEAGINPAAAAGMGASTASAGVVGGTSGPNFKTGGSNISGIGTHPISEINLANTMAMLNYKMQKNISNAEVNKMNAEAELARTQADELTTTRQTRIDKIKSEIGLNEELAEEAIARSNKLSAEESYTKQLEKLAKAETKGKEMTNDIEKIKHDLLMSFPEMERQRIQNEWKKPYFENKMKQLDMMINSAEFNRATVVEREKLIKGWFDSTIGLMIKAGSGAGVFTFN